MNTNNKELADEIHKLMSVLCVSCKRDFLKGKKIPYCLICEEKAKPYVKRIMELNK